MPLGWPCSPNCRKNFSIGEPGANGTACLSLLSSLMLAMFAVSSILTRTEMTAGFTLVTRSANPAGADDAASAACAVDHTGIGKYPAGPATKPAAPRTATEPTTAGRPGR